MARSVPRSPHRAQPVASVLENLISDKLEIRFGRLKLLQHSLDAGRTRKFITAGPAIHTIPGEHLLLPLLKPQKAWLHELRLEEMVGELRMATLLSKADEAEVIGMQMRYQHQIDHGPICSTRCEMILEQPQCFVSVPPCVHENPAIRALKHVGVHSHARLVWER